MRLVLPLIVLSACAVEGDELQSGSLAAELQGQLPAEQLAPPTGPQLASSAAVRGQPARLQSIGHPAGSTVRFARGGSGLFCPPQLGGSCLDLNNPVIMGADISDGMRTATIDFNVPNAPAGASTMMQAANGGAPGSVSTAITAVVESNSNCPAGSINLLRDSDFEAAIPNAYYGNFGSVGTSTQSFTGALSAEVIGNIGVCWDIPDTAVSDIFTAAYWTWHSTTGAVQAVEWTYSDGSNDSFFTSNASMTWENFETLGSMDPSKELASICFYGWTGGTTRFDAMSVCATP